MITESKKILQDKNVLKSLVLETPLGKMIAISDENSLFLLEFLDQADLDHELMRLSQKTKSTIINGYTQPINSIETELKQYFEGKLKNFKTPISFLGTSFQNRVWEELKKVSYGQTLSYLDIAAAIGKPSAYRAIALANSANRLAIIIPCHRIIKSNGDLCGYNGGIMRKEWLINHEKNQNKL